MIAVRWSKTIQYHDRTLLVPVPRIKHSKPCPHEAIINTFNLLGVHYSAKLPNIHIQGSSWTITFYYNETKLKKLLEQCAFDSSQYCGNSFHHGGATFALNCRVPKHYCILSFKEINFLIPTNYKIIVVNMMRKSITH